MFMTSLLLAINLHATPADTVPRERIEREIAALVRIDTVPGPEGTIRVVGFEVDSSRAQSLLGPFLREHGRLVWYLAVHTPGAGARMVGAADDPLLMRDSIVTALRADTTFNNRLLAMLRQFWRASGRGITGREAAPLRPAVRADELRRIGARFFYPDRMSATGDTMFTHICAGINGISELPAPVDPLVEAFVFVAVNSALFGRSETPLMRAFDVAFKRAKATSVSKEPSTRILRAQGALWAQMERSPALSAAIASAYAKHGAVLPFRVISAVP